MMQSSLGYSHNRGRGSKRICKEHKSSFQESRNLHGNINKSTVKKEVPDDEDEPLSGHPFFMHIVTKSQVQNPYQLAIPKSFQRYLPSASVPVILVCKKKEWEVTYFGDRPVRYLGVCGWRQFVHENNLRIGDGCVFELVDEKNLRFKVRVLSGQIPDVLGRDNQIPEDPINID